MSEHEGESKSVGAFLLGFLTGVLVCIGVGGGFFVVVERQSAMRERMRAAEEAMMEAEAARMEAWADAGPRCSAKPGSGAASPANLRGSPKDRRKSCRRRSRRRKAPCNGKEERRDDHGAEAGAGRPRPADDAGRVAGRRSTPRDTSTNSSTGDCTCLQRRIFLGGWVERWMYCRLELYRMAHPEVVNFVANKARVFVPAEEEETVPEPDAAAYQNFPLEQPFEEIRWQDVSPILVVEVLSADDPNKDLVRNVRLYRQVPSIREYWILDPRADSALPSLIVYRRQGNALGVGSIPGGRAPTRHADCCPASSCS